jgi:flagellar hook-basal body complex protein FliE
MMRIVGGGLENITGGEGLGGIGGAGPVRGIAGSGGEGGGFAEALQTAVRSVEGSQAKADDGLRALASGQGTDLHGTMIALEEANISLRTMGSVRDKLVDGWQTVWNMQI